MVTAGQAGQKGLLLLFGSPLEYWQRVQREVNRDRLAHRRIAVFQRFGDYAQRQKVHPGAAVACRQADAEKAKLRHLGQQFVWKGVLAVVLGNDWHDLIAGKVIGHFSNQFVLFRVQNLG